MAVTALLIAACSGGADGDADSSTAPETSTTLDAPSSTLEPAADTVATTTNPTFDDGPLDEVCGDTIVVQTSSFPDVGAGPLYALLGPAPVVDTERQATSAPLTRADGTVEAVTLEIRSGGPAVGFRSPVAVMADDDSIHLAVASTAVSVSDRPLLETRALMTFTDRSRDALIIDPATFPDVASIADVGDQGIEVRHVTDAPVIAFLAADGVIDTEQLVPGSDGLPASFVGAQGAVAQQGDLTIEPVLLPALEQWGRPVTALPAADAGWASLDDLLLADSATERIADECLGRFVRVLQQSVAAYVANPTATNVVMSEARSRFNPLARLTPALLDAGMQIARDAGVFDTALTDPPGTITTDGLSTFLDDLASALGVEPVTVDELVDLRFLDRTISR